MASTNGKFYRGSSPRPEREDILEIVYRYSSCRVNDDFDQEKEMQVLDIIQKSFSNPELFDWVHRVDELKLLSSFPMKRDRNGQAKILSDEEVTAIFNLLNPRDRAIFAICLFCGCRISEALSIQRGDISNGIITIRKANTKGKKGSRSLPKLNGFYFGSPI